MSDPESFQNSVVYLRISSNRDLGILCGSDRELELTFLLVITLATVKISRVRQTLVSIGLRHLWCESSYQSVNARQRPVQAC